MHDRWPSHDPRHIDDGPRRVIGGRNHAPSHALRTCSQNIERGLVCIEVRHNGTDLGIRRRIHCNIADGIKNVVRLRIAAVLLSPVLNHDDVRLIALKGKRAVLVVNPNSIQILNKSIACDFQLDGDIFQRRLSAVSLHQNAHGGPIVIQVLFIGIAEGRKILEVFLRPNQVDRGLIDDGLDVAWQAAVLLQEMERAVKVRRAFDSVVWRGRSVCRLDERPLARLTRLHVRLHVRVSRMAHCGKRRRRRDTKKRFPYASLVFRGRKEGRKNCTL